MSRILTRLGVGSIVALLVVGLLPVTALAAIPTAIDDSTSTNEDVAKVITLVGNDDDGDGLTFAITNTPDHGGLGAISAPDCSGSPSTCTVAVTYTPAPNYHGLDSFAFSVDDGSDAAAGTISITVNSVNDAPGGVNKTVTMLEDDTYTFATADFGFSDPLDSPADALEAVVISTLPGAGTLRHDGSTFAAGSAISAADIDAGQLTFTPAANANGPAYTSFTFRVRDDGGTTNGGVDLDATANTITVNVTSVNDAPNGTNHTVMIDEGGSHTFAASDFGFTDANDSPANVLNAVQIVSVPVSGALRNDGVLVATNGFVTAADIATGKLIFTPATFGSGSPYATFTFKVRDDGGTASGGINLDPTAATMTLNVASVNDAPAGTNGSVTLSEDGSHTFAASEFGFTDSNDTPADSLASVRISTVPTAGTLRNNGVAVTATQSISVADINASKLIFSPAANGNGSPYATFTFQVRDDGGTANGGVDLDPSPNTMTINVTAVNDPPVANNDTKTVDEDSGPSPVTVLTNDTDVDGPSLTVISKTNPAHGTLTLISGVLSYTPTADYNGPDGFDYTISDGTFMSTATVTITVLPINDPPVATDDVVNLTEDPGPTVINVKANDSDVDGDTLTVTLKTDPTHGTLTLVSGVLTYTPAKDYNGPDAFTYTISDGEFTDIGEVAITITAENDPPDAVDDSATITRDAAATVVGVLANDTDVELDTLTITGKTNGAKGTVVITGGGTGLTYDPFTGYSGADSFTYAISDGHGGTDTATVTINITGANRAPNAVNDVSFSVPEGAAAVSLDVAANDDDPDGDTFTIIARTNGAHGITRIGAGGSTVTYDPGTLFHGTDTFTYTIRDAGGLTDTATVVVTVTRDRTAPIVIAPAQRFLGQTVGSTSVKARITWYATDVGSGIKSYLIQESVNGATYRTVTAITPTRNYIDRVLTNGKSYHYRVRATDKEGNVSGWRYTSTFKPLVFQETSGLAKYVGAWSTYKTTAALGGTVRYTSTLGKTVRFTYTVYDVALVMTRTASSGSADIYVDDVLVTRVNLRATRTIYRQLVFTKHFTTLGAHTVEIRPIGTGRVDIDAFPVFR